MTNFMVGWVLLKWVGEPTKHNNNNLTTAQKWKIENIIFGDSL